MFFSILVNIFLVLLALFVWKVYKTATYWKNVGIPHQNYFNYLYTFLVRYQQQDIFEILEENVRKYGPVYGSYQGLRPTLQVTKAEAIKDCLTRNFSKFHGRSVEVETGSKLWDNNILALDYQRWKTVRHLSGQVLTTAKLKLMKEKIEQVARRLRKYLEQKARSSNNEVLTSEYSQSFTMDTTAAMAFNLELDSFKDPKNSFIRHATNIFGPSVGLILLNFLPSIVKYVPFAHFPTKEVEKFFVDFSNSMLKQKRQQPNKGESDFLDIWLTQQKNNSEISDELMVSQIFVFFVAGYETSAYTLTYTLYLLATHPEAQKRAYQELLEIAADVNNITFEEYSKMKFIEGCLLESLRIYPTDAVVDRLTVERCTLDGITLDANIGVQIPIAPIQRDPERFTNPLQYRPERFLSPDFDKSSFLAFGDGPKNCVGKRLATTQLVIGLAQILLQFQLEPSPSCPYDPSLEYQPLVALEPGRIFFPTPKVPMKVCVKVRETAH